jgi:hypothetical protein
MMNNYLMKAGEKAGERWSARQADEKRMAASERVEQILDGDSLAWEFRHSLDSYTISERLYFLLEGIDEHDRDRTDASEFWQSICNDPQPELDFVCGFAAGVELATAPV